MKKLFKNVKDLKECYEIANLPEVENIADIPADYHPVIMDFYRECVVVKAANILRNPEIKLSWLDRTIKKYFPWMYVLPAGGVDYDDTYYFTTYANAGDAARLAFQHPDDAKHGVEIAPDVFEGFLTK